MSSGAGFPINDLLRRRLQTGLVVVTLTLSVASTLFLLLFSGRVGVGLSASFGVFTLGLTSVFGQFLLFIGILVFLVGVILTSFIVQLMMVQRTRDFGLIKAAGCPNSLVGGYFMVELLIVTGVSCVLGLGGGFLGDFVASYVVFGGYVLGAWGFAPVVFFSFFGLAVFFGLQPILKATKMTAFEALSDVNYYGLVFEGGKKTLARSVLSWRMASRSMVRRISSVARIVILLSVVFVLLTISVAGGIIAMDTTVQWVEKTSGTGTVGVAFGDMGRQYERLLTRFRGMPLGDDFDYADMNLGLPSVVAQQLGDVLGVVGVDSRLVLYMDVSEVSNYTALNGVRTVIGSQREGVSLIVGLEPQNMGGNFSSKGQSLSAEGPLEAVIGDSIAQTMYYRDNAKEIWMSDPLQQSIRIKNEVFKIVGVCIDPINNGYVTYVPRETLMNVTGLSQPNLLLVTLEDSVNRPEVIAQMRALVKALDSELEVFDLEPVMAANEAFLGASWQTIMFIPLFSLASAAVCLVSYMMLVVDEQRQEFGVLRAVGARPIIIVKSAMFESAIVLLSSMGIGLSFGVIITLMILMTDPLVSVSTIVLIGGWLGSALGVMFLVSLYPAVRLSKMSILKLGS
ncbi:MAG: ABC transporter permease [Nitrososphaerota archaeon]|jgi:ABC-type antimicrobial peptide transport system permease subunit|nr:ABC transporter permease [Nitrososphaerota archaeon]